MEKEKNKRLTPYAAKARTGRRWSAVDTAILVLVVLAVAGIVARVIVAYRDAEEAKQVERSNYRIHFTVDEMQASVLDEIEGGDIVYIREDGTRLGYIGVELANTEVPAGGETTDESEPLYDKALVARPIEGGTDPDAVTVEGVILCTDWQLVDGSLKWKDGDRLLTRGSVVEVRTDRATMLIRITEIQVVG